LDNSWSTYFEHIFVETVGDLNTLRYFAGYHPVGTVFSWPPTAGIID
jgi:hypothetical protein